MMMVYRLICLCTSPQDGQLKEKLSQLGKESVLSVVGTVQPRPQGQENKVNSHTHHRPYTLTIMAQGVPRLITLNHRFSFNTSIVFTGKIAMGGIWASKSGKNPPAVVELLPDVTPT